MRERDSGRSRFRCRKLVVVLPVRACDAAASVLPNACSICAARRNDKARIDEPHRNMSKCDTHVRCDSRIADIFGSNFRPRSHVGDNIHNIRVIPQIFHLRVTPRRKIRHPQIYIIIGRADSIYRDNATFAHELAQSFAVKSSVAGGLSEMAKKRQEREEKKRKRRTVGALIDRLRVCVSLTGKYDIADTRVRIRPFVPTLREATRRDLSTMFPRLSVSRIAILPLRRLQFASGVY